MRIRLPHEPVLGSAGNLPHLSLIQGDVDPSWPMGQAMAALLGAYRGMAPFRMTFGKVAYQPTGWFFLQVARNASIAKLHAVAFDSLRSCMRAPTEALDTALSVLTAAERDNYLRYGYRYIGDAFNPHVTLGRNVESAEPMAGEARKIVEGSSLAQEWSIDRMTVYAMGVAGAHASALMDVPV